MKVITLSACVEMSESSANIVIKDESPVEKVESSEGSDKNLPQTKTEIEDVKEDEVQQKLVHNNIEEAADEITETKVEDQQIKINNNLQESMVPTQIDAKDVKEEIDASEMEMQQKLTANDKIELQEILVQTQIDAGDVKDEADASGAQMQQKLTTNDKAESQELLVQTQIDAEDVEMQQKLVETIFGIIESEITELPEGDQQINANKNLQDPLVQTQIDVEDSKEEDLTPRVNETEIQGNEEVASQENDAKIQTQTEINESEEPKPMESEIPQTEPQPPEKIQARCVPQPITHDGQEMDETILHLLENRLKQIGITNYNMKMSPGCKPGDNILGIIAKVQINGTDPSGSNTELNWIVKIAPPIQALRRMIKLEILYRNEVLVYESVFPIYKELEKERSIMNGFNSYPEYLFSNLDHLKETVVMTDMTSLGYILRNKREPLDLEHVKLVMKTYGKLHALSYAFQYKMPSLFEEFSRKFQRNIQNAIDVFELKKTQQGIMENALASLDPIRHNLACKKFSKFVENFMAIYFEAARNSNKYSVIGHGDSWINNMLFKYEVSNYSHICVISI